MRPEEMTCAVPGNGFERFVRTREGRPYVGSGDGASRGRLRKCAARRAFLVAQGGIEPPTRGFSVRVSLYLAVPREALARAQLLDPEGVLGYPAPVACSARLDLDPRNTVL